MNMMRAALLTLATMSVLTAPLLTLLVQPAPVHAQEITAEGSAAILNNNMAGARKQALRNAQRNAVEQGVGVLLDSRSISQNFEIIQDKILSSSQGFVSRYKILAEGKTSDLQSYRVKIRATVSRNLLKDRLAALRLLHKAMGQKRVMVIYHSENPHALKRTHGASRSALQTIRDELNRSGFRMFNEGATNKVYQQIARATGSGGEVDDLIAMALDQHADLLVRFENVAGKRGSKGAMFSAAYSTIRISVHETTTGRQVADSIAEGKQLLRAKAGPYDWEKGLADASVKASLEGIKETIGKIAGYYRTIGDEGLNYLVVFQGYDDDQKDLILDYLENTPGFSNLSELKNTRDYMEVELFTSQNASRLRRMIRSGLKKKGIGLQTQSTARNRLVFSNPNK